MSIAAVNGAQSEPSYLVNALQKCRDAGVDVTDDVHKLAVEKKGQQSVQAKRFDLFWQTMSSQKAEAGDMYKLTLGWVIAAGTEGFNKLQEACILDVLVDILRPTKQIEVLQAFLSACPFADVGSAALKLELQELSILASPWNAEHKVEDLERIRDAFSSQSTRMLHKSMAVLSTALEVMNGATAVIEQRKHNVKLVEELRAVQLPDIAATFLQEPSKAGGRKTINFATAEAWDAVAVNLQKVAAKTKDNGIFMENHRGELDKVTVALGSIFGKMVNAGWLVFSSAVESVLSDVMGVLKLNKAPKDGTSKVREKLAKLSKEVPTIAALKLVTLAPSVAEAMVADFANQGTNATSFCLTLAASLETWSCSSEQHAVVLRALDGLALASVISISSF